MNESLKNNQTALRACILYEFADGKPVHESFKNMCRKIGDDAIDYVDFEYWFMRFANGKFDLNYDRSLDPKTPSFSDMPIDILEKIINKLDLMDRLIIRKVSKNYQYIIDSFNPRFKDISISPKIGAKRENVVPSEDYLARFWGCISITIGNVWIHLYYDHELVTYSEPYSCSTVKYGKRQGVIKTENHQNLAFDDLAIVLKNPKLQLEEFQVSYHNNKYCNEMESMLKSLNRKIHVKKLEIITVYPEVATNILSYLEARTIKEIVIYTDRRANLQATVSTKAMMAGIVELEHHKTAEMLTLITYITSSFPIESFLQCRRFTIDFQRLLQPMTILRFTKTLLKSTVLKFAIFKITTKIPLDFEQIDRRAIEVPGRSNVRHLLIQNSNEFFEIEANEDFIRIERIS